MRRLVIVGAGGMGREAIAIARRARCEPMGVVDDHPSGEDKERLSRLGVPLLGGVDFLLLHDAEYIIAIGNPCVREKIAWKLPDEHVAPPLIDPLAAIGPDVKIGNGSIICGSAALSTNIWIGRHAIVNVGCAIMHDTSVGEFATIGPQTTLCGGVNVSRKSYLGAGVTVIPRVSIGERVVVGAGSVVIRDVPVGTTVVGVPAQPIGGQRS